MLKKNIVVSIMSTLMLIISSTVVIYSFKIIFIEKENYENISIHQTELYDTVVNYSTLNPRVTTLETSIPIPSSTNPSTDGTVAIGSSTAYARADHVHPSDTSKANLASPTLTGTPVAPTAAAGTNTTQIATTAFVTTAATNALSTMGTQSYNGPAAVSVATSTYKTVAQLTLSAGTYLFHAAAQFASNATGDRYTLISTKTDSNSNRISVTCESYAPASSGMATIHPIMCVVSPTASTTYYFVAWQNSGKALNVTGRFYAIKIK